MRRPRTIEGKYSVEAVARALDVLEAFRDSEELTLAEISQRVELNKSRVFRLLYTLAERGYVEKSADGLRYSLGIKLVERAAHVRSGLKQVALPYMRQLNEQFNETINLAVLDQGEVLYIEILESLRPVRMAAAIGSRMPIHSTALGKAMTAYVPEAQLKKMMGPQRRGRQGGKAMVDTKRFERDLETTRRRGYAFDDKENEPGVCCVGAPVFDAAGRPLAAISVSGPAHRISSNQEEIAAAVVRACGEISRKLGFNDARRDTHHAP
jgi:DNA-binding IclR family transcriptional regulator